MSLLSEALNEYIAMRRNLGFVFRVPASLLRTFVAFVDQAGSPFITTELARQWLCSPSARSPVRGPVDSPSRGASRCGAERPIGAPRCHPPTRSVSATAGNRRGFIAIRTWST